MQPSHQYLIEYLEEEFSRSPEIRVRVIPRPQQTGVTVKTETREYFFPFAWAEENAFDRVEALVRKIKDL